MRADPTVRLVYAAVAIRPSRGFDPSTDYNPVMLQLEPQECRVLGVLVEKALTTPIHEALQHIESCVEYVRMAMPERPLPPGTRAG